MNQNVRHTNMKVGLVPIAITTLLLSVHGFVPWDNAQYGLRAAIEMVGHMTLRD